MTIHTCMELVDAMAPNGVASSVKLNEAAKLPAYFDKVFTVYDKKTIARDNIQINCGARSCKGCQICYKPNPKGVDVMQVRERVK